MAITNQERIGKAMDRLRASHAPFVERRKRPAEAFSDDGLVQSWLAIVRLAPENR